MRPLVLFLFLALTACSGTHEPRKDKAAVAKPSAWAKLPVYDVPTLVGLSVSELYQRLGPPLPLPAGFVDPVSLPLLQRGVLTDSSALLRKGNLDIVVTFDINTRQVSDLMLLGDDEEELMERGKLQLTSEKYLILPVFREGRPGQLMGLRVVEMPRSK